MCHLIINETEGWALPDQSVIAAGGLSQGIPFAQPARLLAIFGFLMLGIGAAICNAQPAWDEVNFRAGQVGGLHLNGVSVYTGYSTSAYPLGLGSQPSAGYGGLGPDVSYGAATSVGWQYHRRSTDFSALYGLSYSGMARYSNLNAFGHVLTLDVSRKLSRKWRFGIAGSGSLQTMSQLVFQPSVQSIQSQLATDINDLAAASSAGQAGNSQAVNALTGTSLMASPAQSALLGERVLTYGGTASLSYAAARHWTVDVSSSIGGGKNRMPGSATVQNYVMPLSIGASAGVGYTRDLSPRTTVSVNVSEDSQSSHFQTSYTSTATTSVNRKMGQHWFLQMTGGGSYIQIVRKLYNNPPQWQGVGGASLGVKTYQHTLSGSYNRTATGALGLAAGTFSTISGTWNFHHPGSRWNLNTSYGQNQVRNTGFSSTSGWIASTGISTTISAQTNLSLEYSFLRSHGNFLGNQTQLDVQSVRLAFGWSPAPAIR